MRFRRRWERSWDRGYGYGHWAPYVPVAERRAKAKTAAAQLAKKAGRKLQPINIEGRAIAHSFWGKAWCDNLEAYSDFANRLPRGRTYVRNGSVLDLVIGKGKVEAVVSGSEIYNVSIKIRTLPSKQWEAILDDCSKSIASLLDLIQGRFDKGVMERLTRVGDGLFPQPREIEIKCSCPDYAVLCKHAAAVLYGVGARLDSAPELLFTLRNVDQLELIGKAATADNLDQSLAGDAATALAGNDLGELFGIELDTSPRKRAAPKAKSTIGKSAASPRARRAATTRLVGSAAGNSNAKRARTKASNGDAAVEVTPPVKDRKTRSSPAKVAGRAKRVKVAK